VSVEIKKKMRPDPSFLDGEKRLTPAGVAGYLDGEGLKPPQKSRGPPGYPPHIGVTAEEVALSRTIVGKAYTSSRRTTGCHSPPSPALKGALVRPIGSGRRSGLLGGLAGYGTVVSGDEIGPALVSTRERPSPPSQIPGDLV
jgi:hypothetical protein